MPLCNHTLLLDPQSAADNLDPTMGSIWIFYAGWFEMGKQRVRVLSDLTTQRKTTTSEVSNGLAL